MQTVLVVDDDDSARGLLQLMLEIEGFTVHQAATARDALKIVAGEPIDLVTIGTALTDMSGLELAAELRQLPETAHCRQLIVSGQDLGPETSAYVDAVLIKPFDFTSFTAVLRTMLAPPVTVAAVDPVAEELDRILTDRLIEPMFQPIVDLATLEVVGVEGLARGPAESQLHMPNALFSAAHQLGRLHELDALCRYSAIAAARDHAGATPPLVFVNVEPGTAELPMSPELRALLQSDLPFQIVVEFTERALTRRLPALMRHASEIRSRGNIVALDDMGLDARAVALLPLVQPEIVKLDMSLVQGRLTDSAATIAAAVATFAERTGARVIAEGIETQEHLTTALALGANWGQGWLFGRPGPLDTMTMKVASARPPTPRRKAAVSADVRSPFEWASSEKAPRRGTLDVIDGISRNMESQARALGNLAVLLVVLEHEVYEPGPMRRDFEDLALQSAVVGILGVGIPDEPFPGAHGVDLSPGDVLGNERVILVLGPYEAALLCARRRRDDSLSQVGSYDFVMSHDRDLVEDIARMLLGRFTPRHTLGRTTALSPTA